MKKTIIGFAFVALFTAMTMVACNEAISIHAPARGATAIITKYQSKLL